MKNPSPGSWRGGSGRPGETVVPTGAALIATIRRTPTARIAVTMTRVPGAAIPASVLLCGPRQDSTASAPATAGASSSGPDAARSAGTTRTDGPAATPAGSLAGLRTTTVTS